jgi:hypothetical protein
MCERLADTKIADDLLRCARLLFSDYPLSKTHSTVQRIQPGKTVKISYQEQENDANRFDGAFARPDKIDRQTQQRERHPDPGYW